MPLERREHRPEYDAIASRAVNSLGLRDLHGRAAAIDDLRECLARHPLEDWLQTVGKTSHTLADLPPHDASIDWALADSLGPLARRAKQKLAEGARIVSPQGLTTVAREALLYSPEDDPVGWHRSGGLRDLARARSMSARRRRSAFPSTITSESAIAAAAISGFSSPRSPNHG